MTAETVALYQKWLKDTLPRLSEWANSDADDNGHCPIVEDEAGWICSYIESLLAERRKHIEVLEEVALPPYADSDLLSLLETLRTRAKQALAGGESHE